MTDAAMRLPRKNEERVSWELDGILNKLKRVQVFWFRLLLNDNFQVNTEQKNNVSVKLITGRYSEVSLGRRVGRRNAHIASIRESRAKTTFENFSSAMKIVSEVVITANGTRLN